LYTVIISNDGNVLDISWLPDVRWHWPDQCPAVWNVSRRIQTKQGRSNCLSDFEVSQTDNCAFRGFIDLSSISRQKCLCAHKYLL